MKITSLEDYTKKVMIDHLIGVEGDYSDIAVDRGGKTRYGITEKTAIAHKHLWNKYGFTGVMSELPYGLAFEIYELSYWAPLKLDTIHAIHPLLADRLLDISVNASPSLAGMFLQRTLNSFNRVGKDYSNLKVDGIVGSKTIEAFNMLITIRGKGVIQNLVFCLLSLQQVHYLNLTASDESQEAFTLGWSNRVKDAILNYARFFLQ